MKVLLPENCTLDERTMKSNNIQLRSSRWSSTSTYYSGDYIFFECGWWYRPVSRPEKFSPECLDGVIKYPTCERKCWLLRTRRGAGCCRRHLFCNCLPTALRNHCGAQAWSSRLFPLFLFTLQGDGNKWKWLEGAQLWEWKIPRPT